MGSLRQTYWYASVARLACAAQRRSRYVTTFPVGSTESPSRRRGRRAAALLLLAAFAVPFVAGCGKKGDPEPPIRQIPAAPADFELVRRGDRLLLSLRYPRVTAAGTPLEGLSEVTTWQLVGSAPAGDGPLRVDERQFLAGAQPLRVLEGPELDAAVVGDRIAFELPAPPPPEGAAAAETARPAATLAVKLRGAAREESAFSELRSVRLGPVSEPPRGIEAEAIERGVQVTWEYPEGTPQQDTEEAGSEEDAAGDEIAEETATPADGTEEGAGDAEEQGGAAEDGLAGFNLYRRLATERVYGEPVRSVGPRARRVVDGTARFGQRYIYTVTAVDERRPVLVESGFAEEVEVAYRDTFAPPVPGGVVALFQEGAAGASGAVRVVWRGVDAEDLAGYVVHRRGPDSQELRPLTPEPVSGSEFVDRDVAPDATYTYRVSAVDEDGNESGLSAPATATTR